MQRTNDSNVGVDGLASSVLKVVHVRGGKAGLRSVDKTYPTNRIAHSHETQIHAKQTATALITLAKMPLPTQGARKAKPNGL